MTAMLNLKTNIDFRSFKNHKEEMTHQIHLVEISQTKSVGAQTMGLLNI